MSKRIKTILALMIIITFILVIILLIGKIIIPILVVAGAGAWAIIHLVNTWVEQETKRIPKETIDE